jgi:hypothetical protein
LEKNMKAMHVRMAVVVVLLLGASGRAETFISADQGRFTLSNWSAQSGGDASGVQTNDNITTDKTAVAVNTTDGASVVPEPSATTLVFVGVLALMLIRPRRR